MTSQSLDDDELIEKIHVLLGVLLREFDRVCRELSIDYSVYGGTAIGAVRDKGFIPWDDDVDIMLTRTNYERFLREAPEHLGEEFGLDNTRTNPDFPFMFTKMVLRNTLLIPEFAKNSRYRMPFFIDILPVDEVPDDARKFSAMKRSSWLWGRLLFLQGTPRPYLIGISGIQRTAIYTATSLAHYGMKVIRLTPRVLQRQWDRAARRYEGSGFTRYADFTMRDPENWVVSDDEFFPTRDIPFTTPTGIINVKIHHEYDRLLRRGYGDYMTPPPVAQRRNHVPAIVDFGPWNDLVEQTVSHQSQSEDHSE
ncbi:LicD family protein [Actinomyces vulturis]|uniref:LicD family protein n=1 Tax=Actinomyces vulturis TaxID=1857645 RepID=UPI0008331EE5|nr:LicD family protein [Actinomyces vulturis]